MAHPHRVTTRITGMTDAPRSSLPTGDKPGQAGQPAGRRRSRGRKRRKPTSAAAAGASSSTPAAVSDAKTAPSAKTGAKANGKPSDKPSDKPKAGRRSRRRGGRNRDNNAKQSGQADTGRRSKRRSGAKGNGGQRRSQTQTNNRAAGKDKRGAVVETSAGGLVLSGLAESVRPDGSVNLDDIYVALIGRLDRRGRLLWSMPKGHVEADESRHATAQREVWEETGVWGEVFADLGTISYRFVSEGTHIHKTVHHHLLRYVDGILNDEDPEVTEVAWIPVVDLVDKLTYADERRLAHIALRKLPRYAKDELKAGRMTPR